MRGEGERTKRALVFGEVAELYDRARPSYPQELVDAVVAAIPGAPEARVLEVGAGTGKATTLFAPRVGSLVALEPDPAMATIAERHAQSFDNLSVVVDSFENWVTNLPPFAAIIAAHCWHWVDPRVAYSKARALVQDDGVLAAFWNVPDLETSPLYGAVNDAYREHAPSLEDKMNSTRRELRRRARPSSRLPPRGAARVRLGPRVHVTRVHRHARHALRPPPAARRAAGRTDARGRQVIDDAGGTITMRYECVLLMLAPE